MDAQTEERIAAVPAVVLRRLTTVIDVHDGVHRPRGMAVLHPARDRGGSSGGEGSQDSAREDLLGKQHGLASLLSKLRA